MNEHLGDPCIYCGTPHDSVEIGDCPGKSGPRPGTGWLDGIGTVRACIDCGVLVAGGPTRCMDRAQKVGPKFTVEYDPAEGAPVPKLTQARTLIHNLPPGAVFKTDDGVQAVKSEYKLRPNEPGGPTMCIIIGSGEFFHADKGDKELVTWIF